MDALFQEQQAEEVRMLAAERHARAVGAFEGAMYEARGYYRPQADCIMFTRNPVPFCAVCRRALTAVIDLYAAGGQGSPSADDTQAPGSRLQAPGLVRLQASLRSEAFAWSLEPEARSLI